MIATTARKASASLYDMSHIGCHHRKGFRGGSLLPSTQVVSAIPLPAIVAHARREMLPLQLGRDASDDAGTKLGITRQLGGDVAQEAVTVAWRDRAGCSLQRAASPGPTVFRHCVPHGIGGHRVEADGCALPQQSRTWLKSKNPADEAVRRESEEEWR